MVQDLLPSLELDLPSEHGVLTTAAIKEDHPMAYTDAFAAAASAHEATLLTDGATWEGEDPRPTAGR